MVYTARVTALIACVCVFSATNDSANAGWPCGSSVVYTRYYNAHWCPICQRYVPTPAPRYEEYQTRVAPESGEVVIRGNEIFYVDKRRRHILYKLNETGAQPYQWQLYSERVPSVP